MLRPKYGDKYTFLSPHGNVEFLYQNFNYDDIPKDTDLAMADATGPRGELLGFSVKARSSVSDLSDPSQNRILIQGGGRAWVNDTYARFNEMVTSSKEPLRNIVYQVMPVFVWVTFFVLAYLEYRLFRWLTGFSWTEPLNSLQLLFSFTLLAITLIGSSFGFQWLLPLLFPYFELENNLSRSRKTMRKPVLSAIAALYGAGVLLFFGLK